MQCKGKNPYTSNYFLLHNNTCFIIFLCFLSLYFSVFVMFFLFLMCTFEFFKDVLWVLFKVCLKLKDKLNIR